MSEVVMRTRPSNAPSVLRASRSRANDNVAKVAAAPESEIGGAFVPITFEAGLYAPVARVTRHPAVVRRMSSRGRRRAANFNGRGTFVSVVSARILGHAARLWHAFWRGRDIARAVSRLRSMTDMQLSDIGVQRCDIDFIVRHGRSGDTGH